MRSFALLAGLALLSVSQTVLSAPLVASPSTTIPALSSSTSLKVKATTSSASKLVKPSPSSSKATSTTTTPLQNPLSPTPTPIAAPVHHPDDLVNEPPPLFDPWEARPAPLFYDGPQKPQTALRPPPIPQSRSEVLLPHDGAHVHPINSPYPPNKADVESWGFYAAIGFGRSTFTVPGGRSPACSMLAKGAKFLIGAMVLLLMAYSVVAAAEKVLCCCIRRRRRRGQSLTARLVAPIIAPESPWSEKEKERERLRRERSRSPIPQKKRGESMSVRGSDRWV